jgi:hypothetical protein
MLCVDTSYPYKKLATAHTVVGSAFSDLCREKYKSSNMTPCVMLDEMVNIFSMVDRVINVYPKILLDDLPCQFLIKSSF